MLYQHHRPKTFEEVIGNGGLIQSISKMLSCLETCPHVFLLTGETGTGKTTMSRIIASHVGAKGLDIHEIDNATCRSIDDIRNIRKQSDYMPIESDAQVWILDEMHQLLAPAQNALLKILEDTPKHVYFVLCTTDPQKLLPTLRGRCSQFQLNKLTDSEMLKLLRRVVKAEGCSLEKPIYEQIINDAQGHPRNALTVLEQVLRVEPARRLEVAQKSAEQANQAIDLCRALIGNKSWKEVAGILAGLKDQDPEGVRRVVLGYCQSILLKGENNKAAAIMECFLEPFYNSGFPMLVFSAYSVLKGE